MNGFLAFTKKEMTEQLRSYKSVILIAILFLFGMMSPLLAKMLPDILSGMNIQGMTIDIPAPTALDAYTQFFKNVGQMGLVVMLLIFSGVLAQDVTKGTLIVLLAKGLSRHAVILSKFISSLLLWTVGYTLSAATSYGYTAYLFGSAAVPHLFFTLFCLWLFGTFIIALLILASTLVRGNYGGLILSAGILVFLMILYSFPVIGKWNPVSLAAQSMGLLSGTVATTDLTASVWMTAILTGAFMVLSVLIFRKKRL